MDNNQPAFSPPASTRSVQGLVLNCLVPGVGSLVGGRTVVGVIQLAMFLLGFPLIFLFGLGLLLIAGAWIWAVIVGVQMMGAGTAAGPPPNITPPSP